MFAGFKATVLYHIRSAIKIINAITHKQPDKEYIPIENVLGEAMP